MGNIDVCLYSFTKCRKKADILLYASDCHINFRLTVAKCCIYKSLTVQNEGISENPIESRVL